ncbi:MAG: SH3 domain-containing protein [Acidimicrobiia bacterium]|nr:SH3 domain-containing protein [Acidimicrobiia bacterium]
MNPEDRIKEAFSELRARTRADLHTRTAFERTVSPRRPTMLPVISAALLVAIVIGGAILLDLFPGGETPVPPALSQPETTQPAETVPASEAISSTSPPTSATTPEATETPPSTTPPTSTEDHYRVNTDLVEADVDDPFLNVRESPSASAPIVVSLPPEYDQVHFTGDESTSDDGALWWRVELGEPVDGETSGWVNTAYLLPVGDAPDVPGQPPTGPDCYLDEPPGAEGDKLEQATLTKITFSELDQDCRQYVLTFEPSVPSYTELQSGNPYRVTLGSVVAEQHDAAGLYVTRTPGGPIDLVIPGAEDGWTSRDGNQLTLTIQMSETPPANDLVALTQTMSIANGSVEVVGVARAFEANLGVHIADSIGDPVGAVYDGTYQGTVQATEVGIQTTDWIDAWGEFAFRASGLPAGSYTLVLDSGSENTDNSLRLPFTITTGGEANAPGDDANQLLSEFRSQTTQPTLDFADEVWFGLMEGHTQWVPGSDLADPETWSVSLDGWRGRDGMSTSSIWGNNRQPLPRAPYRTAPRHQWNHRWN